jgi:hypothetical protein
MRLLIATLVILVATIKPASAQDCDPHWDTLNGGVNGGVLQMVRLPNGDIVVGGEFTMAGDVPANNIARWDGTAWHALSDGIDRLVTSIGVRPNGNIIVLGNHRRIDDQTNEADIREWNGSTWTRFPVTVGGYGTYYLNYIDKVVALGDDELLAFGRFLTLNGQSISTAARYADGVWTQHGPAGFSGSLLPRSVRVLQQLANGSLHAWGEFHTVNQPRLESSLEAIFDGQVWRFASSIGPWPGQVCAYLQAPDGSEYIGGNMLGWSGQSNYLLKRRNGAIVSLGFSTHTGYTVSSISQVDSERLFIGGALPGVNNIAILQNDILRPIGAGTNATVTNSLSLPNGQIIVAGGFTSIGGRPAGRIATGWVVHNLQIDRQPQDQAVAAGSTVTFSLQTSARSGCPTAMSFQWQRRDPRVLDPNASNAWINLTDDGNFVNTTQPTFSILTPSAGLATGFRCQITTCSCRNPIYSDEVNFSIACPADFNADGGVDFTDVEAFFERWENGC